MHIFLDTRIKMDT